MIYEAEIPPEPPVGTVVLDKEGLAWQRISMRKPYPCWVAAQMDFGGGRTNYWPKLLMEGGPLKELYQPEPAPMSNTAKVKAA